MRGIGSNFPRAAGDLVGMPRGFLSRSGKLLMSVIRVAGRLKGSEHGESFG